MFGAYLITDYSLIREPMWKLLNLSAIAETSLVATIGAVFAVAIVAVIIGCVAEAARLLIVKWLGIEKLFQRADAAFNKRMYKDL